MSSRNSILVRFVLTILIISNNNDDVTLAFAPFLTEGKIRGELRKKGSKKILTAHRSWIERVPPVTLLITIHSSC